LNNQLLRIAVSGDAMLPAMVICAGVVVLVPLSPCLIFGFGLFYSSESRERALPLSSSTRREPQFFFGTFFRDAISRAFG